MAGCSIYKPYSRPEMEVIVDSLYRDVEKPDTISIASVPWNRLFTDAYLQDLITIGLRQNTDLRIARTKVEAAEAVLMKAQLSYLPSLSLTPEGGISHAADQTVAKT